MKIADIDAASKKIAQKVAIDAIIVCCSEFLFKISFYFLIYFPFAFYFQWSSAT